MEEMRMAPKRRSAPKTRRRVLEAAAAVYAEGALAAPTDAVWRKAEMTKGAVYHHFQDKKTLAQSVVDEAQRHLMLCLKEQEPGLQTFIDFGLIIGYWYPRNPFIGALLRLTADIRAADHGVSLPAEEWIETNQQLLIAALTRHELHERYCVGSSGHVMREIARFAVDQWVGAVATPIGSAEQVEDTILGFYRFTLPTLANEAVLPQLDLSPGRAAQLAQAHAFFQDTSAA
ncbi:TetR family transcriptional regulator [Streptomyces sp. NPDC059122]|uniref:TetR family transcriptional regulator n=1 Tax=Streptomyces sp. NPDC059122 TaxID=3346732 RepID=UPI0036B3C6C3